MDLAFLRYYCRTGKGLEFTQMCPRARNDWERKWKNEDERQKGLSNNL